MGFYQLSGFVAYITLLLGLTWATRISQIEELSKVSCTCSVAAEVYDDSPVHDFGEISLDEKINNNLFAAPKYPQPTVHPATCHFARHQCKTACATRLDLQLHYERFTPLGLMLCKQLGIDTPVGGALVVATPILNTTLCARHNHNRHPPLKLKSIKGEARLCCGTTQIVNEAGNTVKRFGWNPDCQSQVYYLT